MEYEAMVQSVIDDIDRRITENIRAVEPARAVNYSVYHFCRVFSEVTGTPVSAYITRRKLKYALYELSKGRKVIDVAVEYGFETHAGFTKAFKKYFGCPLIIYRLCKRRVCGDGVRFHGAFVYPPYSIAVCLYKDCRGPYGRRSTHPPPTTWSGLTSGRKNPSPRGSVVICNVRVSGIH